MNTESNVVGHAIANTRDMFYQGCLASWSEHLAALDDMLDHWLDIAESEGY